MQVDTRERNNPGLRKAHNCRKRGSSSRSGSGRLHLRRSAQNGGQVRIARSNPRWLTHFAFLCLAAACRSTRIVTPRHQRYDAGMTRAKIAISLPKDQLVRVHREIRAGRADSVSGYIARVLAEHERRESLRALLRDLIEQYGEPAAEDVKWAKRALAPRRG